MELLSIDEKAMQEAQKALDDAKINGTVEDIRKAKMPLIQHKNTILTVKRQYGIKTLTTSTLKQELPAVGLFLKPKKLCVILSVIFRLEI